MRALHTKLFLANTIIQKEESMDKDELLQNYVNAIYQNINAGLQAFEDILPKIQDDSFKNLVAEMQDKYYTLSKECEVYAKSEDIKGIKDNSWLEKVRMWMSVNMSTMTDKSNRKIAELLLIGSFKVKASDISTAGDLIITDFKNVLSLRDFIVNRVFVFHFVTELLNVCSNDGIS